MKVFRLSVLFLLLFGAAFSYAQQVDEKSEADTELNLKLKGLDQDDMLRLFPDLYGKKTRVLKTEGDPREIREVIIAGNKITSAIFNYGAICKPNYLPNIADLVWNGLGYGFEFGLIVAGEVVSESGEVLTISSDAHVLTSQGDYNPSGSLKWGWLPKAGYAAEGSLEIATLNAPDDNFDGKPDSWPERWYNDGAGTYLWPAFLGDEATSPDEEVYYVMDDFTNAEFDYYPFPDDDTKRGLGLECETRILQFNNPLVEDIIFMVYNITNVSPKVLPKLYFGMHGDPHVGGPNNYADDRGYFIPPKGDLAENYPQPARSMVFAWDNDATGDGGRFAGYFGWKMLETPSFSFDGEDNDDDGVIDESPWNPAGVFIDGASLPLTYGIDDVQQYTDIFGAPKPRWEGDEDGDWEADKHDVGIDGIGFESAKYPGPDYGEGDGEPSQAFYLDANENGKMDPEEEASLSDTRIEGYKWAGSEPNFGQRDVNESDQIGLTSFHAASYGGFSGAPQNDPLIWEWFSADSINPDQELLSTAGDNVFNFATGPVELKSGESQRFSMAILFGDNLSDLVLNASTSTRVLEVDYRFARPPLKPIVEAAPGDGKVTLYWDDRAEDSFDPFVGTFDFQGYKIYRSTDPKFSDIYSITDGNGSPFLGRPLEDGSGTPARFDLDDSLSGYHPIAYQGRGLQYYLGDNTGLVHEYVDSTVKNGVTYYYAVVSYDHGDIAAEIPPSESQAVIQTDPITGELEFDVNTVSAKPNGIAEDLEPAFLSTEVMPGRPDVTSTGDIYIKIINDLKVGDRVYSVTFQDDTTYSLLDSTITESTFTAKDTLFADLLHDNVKEGTLTIKDQNGTVIPLNSLEVDYEGGKVRGVQNGVLNNGETYVAEYRYYIFTGSSLLNMEDSNPSFDGMKIYLQNDVLQIDHQKSRFTSRSDINVKDTVYSPALNGFPIDHYRSDWEIRWNDLDTNAAGEYLNVGYETINQLGGTVQVPFVVWNLLADEEAPTVIIEDVPATRGNGRWDWGENILIQPQELPSPTAAAYEVQFAMPDSGITPVFPEDGDIYLVKTSKPFFAGDQFYFKTSPSEPSSAKADESLNDIYVVPNPYVGYSKTEQPGRTADLRGEKEIQFRNLPSTCTIRIYTITGELIQTIEKNDMSNYASWDLLSEEGQRIAYGVYIYHVDVPDAGEYIGRFAVIK